MYGQIKIPPEKSAPQSLHGEDQGAGSRNPAHFAQFYFLAPFLNLHMRFL